METPPCPVVSPLLLEHLKQRFRYETTIPTSETSMWRIAQGSGIAQVIAYLEVQAQVQKDAPPDVFKQTQDSA